MEPITREEKYLATAAGYDVTPPEPVTRKELFLAKAAGMDVETPSPITREEMFLSRIQGDSSSGGSSGGSSGSGGGASFKLTDDGEGNVTIENAALVDNDGALVITLVVNTSELNGHVTVGG